MNVLIKNAGVESAHFSTQIHGGRITLCVFQMNPSESRCLCTNRRLKMRRAVTRDFTVLSLVASPLVTSTQSALKKVSGSLAQYTDAFNSVNPVLSQFN